MWIPLIDKIAHFFLFGLLATLIYRYRQGHTNPGRLGLIAVCVTVVYGLIDELHQYQTPQRYFELADIFADLIGAIVAVSVYSRWSLYRETLEHEFFRRG